MDPPLTTNGSPDHGPSDPLSSKHLWAAPPPRDPEVLLDLEAIADQPDPMAAECQGIVSGLGKDIQKDLAEIEERVTYAPKAGVKCTECETTFNAVKCPSCGAVDHSHPLVRFGEQVGGQP